MVPVAGSGGDPPDPTPPPPRLLKRFHGAVDLDATRVGRDASQSADEAAVSDYLEWFEAAYFLFTVRIFDASLARRNTNPKSLLH